MKKRLQIRNIPNVVLILIAYIIILLDYYKVHVVSSFSTTRTIHNNHNYNNNGGDTPSKNQKFLVYQVNKVPKEEFDVHTHYFHKQKYVIDNNVNEKNKLSRSYETPVLIQNVLDPSQCEDVCDSLVYNLGHMKVDLQRKRKVAVRDNTNERIKNEQTKIYEYSLDEAFSLMMESKRDDSLFCFCEGLLDSQLGEESAMDEIEQVKKFLTSARESVFVQRRNNEDVHDDKKSESINLFDYFPESVKPSDCLILAGEGATSTLHRDPFCWTGTSLCLEGTKVWRFIAPPGAMRSILANENNNVHNENGCTDSDVTYVDTLLESYRLTSVAWDDHKSESEDPIYLSSGWQSDYSLYSSFNDQDYPSAEILASIDDDEKIALIEDLSKDLDTFSPNCPQSYTDSEYEDSQVSIWTVIQNPGDLLIIPAHWWHQTYAFEPSLAIASQRCGRERDSIRVFGHMADTLIGQEKCLVNDINLNMVKDEEYMEGQSSGEDLVQTFFRNIKSQNTN